MSVLRGILTVLALLAALAAAGRAVAEEPLYYEESEGAVVFTNTPTNPGARVVPGFEVAEPEAVAASAPAELPSSIYDSFIDRLAREYRVSAELIKAVAVVESDLNPHAVSRKGAMGLMQLMPETARAHGVRDAFDPLQNLRGGTRYLSALLLRYDHDLDLALAAYNAGPGAVRRHGGVPGFPETERYIRRVRQRLGQGSPGGLRAGTEPPPANDAEIVRRPDGSIELVN